MRRRPPLLPSRRAALVALAVASVASGALVACAPRTPANAPSAGDAAAARPLVIAHRGASGHRPEHTLAAYELAIDMGADFVEPDLVITRDGVLVARHENEIGGTTDAAERFPARRATKTVDGARVTGWFAEDFTLAELKTLRAKERLPSRGRAHDGRYPVPTFEEVLDLVAAKARALGRPVGVYPETKHPSYFRALGLPLEEPLAAALARRGLGTPAAPVFVQSFEVGNLKRLRALTGARLVQLVGAEGAPWDLRAAGDPRAYADLVTPAGLAEVAAYAAAVGAEKRLVQPLGPGGALGEPTSLVRDAHRAGLLVHVWTLRRDAPFLPAAYRGDGAAEWRRFAALGVDGIFGDFPDDGARAFAKR